MFGCLQWTVWTKWTLWTAAMTGTLLLLPALAGAESVSSPDGRITVEVGVEKQLTWSLTVDGTQVVSPSPLALTLYKGKTLGEKPKVREVKTAAVDETITPVVAEKRAVIPNKYNELRIAFAGDYTLAVRVFDDGAAWRFETALGGDIVVEDETASFVFPGDHTVMRTKTKTVQTSFESPYTTQKLSEWTQDELAFAPLLVRVDGGPALVLTESDLYSYPGMFLARDKKDATTLRGHFAPYPKKEVPFRDRYIRVREGEPFIAKTSGTRTFPWRVVGVARRDAELIENDMVYRLNRPCALADTSWIKPGKVAWDWWHANQMWNVDFTPGVNTATYKRYIDFAAANGLEYAILDEGWSDTRDVTKLSPEVDLLELIRYGKEKNVGLVLWCVWCTLDRQREEFLSQLEEWGVKGVKVDFMDRDDQVIVEFYERMAKATAAHHLLLDFHGAFKPTGLRREYPNLITREGVAGMEQSKWSVMSDPEYCTGIPFIRMFAGPMDYTPGAMRNAQKGAFQANFDLPSSMGTRCHQLAMYTVFESPLQMLSDSPSAYDENPESRDFIAAMPVTWDETRALDGKAGDFVVVARRNGERWFLGAMTDWDAREVTVPLSFLGAGEWKAVVFEDGPEAAVDGTSHTRSEKTVSASDTFTLKLAPGGGFAARFERP